MANRQSPPNRKNFQSYPLLYISLLLLFCQTFAHASSNTAVDTLWSENWEDTAWTDRWDVPAGVWDAGIPTSGPGSAHSGDRCAATKLTGDYLPYANARLEQLQSQSFTVPGANQNPRLRFWHWFDISYTNTGYPSSYPKYDSGMVQIKVGQADWKTISTQYMANGGGWTNTSIDLSPFADSTVRIAFYFRSDDLGETSGWYIDDIALVTGPLTFKASFEDWETGIGDWYAENGTWQIGIPTSGPDSAYSGSNSAGTVLNGNYPPYANSRLVSPPLLVPSLSDNPHLRFWHWFDISYTNTGYPSSYPKYDSGMVQIKVGQADWKTISTQYMANGGGWTNTSIDLSPFADSTVQIAFCFKSDDLGETSGWYIDDITLITGPIVFNNPEGWEAGTGDWYADLGTWQVGVPSGGPLGAHSGQNCLWTAAVGTISSSFISPFFTVPSASTNPSMRFWHWYSLGGGTNYVQIRTKNGPWQDLLSYTQNSGDVWSRPYADLTAYADSTVQLGFFWTGGSWYIDDIIILPKFWVGGPDSSWNTASNWYPFGVPKAGDTVIIYPSSYNPTVSVPQANITVDVLKILSGAKLTVTSAVPLFIVKDASINGTINLDPLDTLVVQKSATTSLSGSGKIHGGTIQRSIAGQAGKYRFESESTYVQLYNVGTNPSTLTMTAYPDSFPPHVDSAFTVKRFYDISQTGGSGFQAKLSLRFEEAETSYFNHGIYKFIRSTNQGISWDTLDPGIVDADNFTITLDSITEFSRWAIIRPKDTGISGDNVEHPYTFRLDQNYPNPFNPVTTINFSLKNQSVVFLKIYDVLGREIATLISDTRPPGSYKINWDASNQPSGIYFYQLRTPSFTDTKKLVLIR